MLTELLPRSERLLLGSLSSIVYAIGLSQQLHIAAFGLLAAAVFGCSYDASDTLRFGESLDLGQTDQRASRDIGMRPESDASSALLFAFLMMFHRRWKLR